MRQIFKVLAIAVMATVAVAGCKKKEEMPPAEGMPPHGMMEQKAAPVVVVPESEKGKWKAVKLAVADKSHPLQNNGPYRKEHRFQFRSGNSVPEKGGSREC